MLNAKRRLDELPSACVLGAAVVGVGVDELPSACATGAAVITVGVVAESDDPEGADDGVSNGVALSLAPLLEELETTEELLAEVDPEPALVFEPDEPDDALLLAADAALL